MTLNYQEFAVSSR